MKRGPASYFVDAEKLILKFKWRDKIVRCLSDQLSIRLTSTMLKEKNRAGELTLSDFKTHYTVTTLKIAQYLQKNK